jgi:2-polyprenyl-3-methyl-5-hydroxy-6-metoxy-1,4-benzoquinol methylase
VRHFVRPRQLNPLKLLRLYRLAKQQGMLFPTTRQPVTIDSAAIPADFLESFEKDCCERECGECGYCAAIARSAVHIDPEFREQSHRRLEQFTDSLRGGSLWGLYCRRVAPEVMDDPDLDASSHRAALEGLARLNAVRGAAAALWPPIAALAGRTPGKVLRLLDVATGGGDIPLRLWRRAQRARVPLEITGVDVSPRAVEWAAKRAAEAGAPLAFDTLDVRKGIPSGFDIVTCSLFLHHLDNREAIALLGTLAGAAGRLLLVSDLARSRVNTFLVGAAAHLVSRSPVVHKDAARSARAAFTLEEARGMARAAGLRGFAVARHGPCCFLLRWQPRVARP